MPLYEIEHITPLSSSQKDALARSITQIHSHLFTTPSLFVNVRFTDTASHDVYVGGKKVSYNDGRTGRNDFFTRRKSPSRLPSAWNEMT